MSLQLDFGGFDPAFIGVSVKLQNIQAATLLKEFRANPTPIPVNHLTDEDRFDALSIISTNSHEVRHFHDFLLTSYSAHVFFYRTQVIVNMLQAIRHLMSDDSNCIPVPIPKWCRLTAAQRETELQYLGERPDGRPWIPVSLPFLTETESLAAAMTGTDAAALIAAAITRRQKIGELTFNPQTQIGSASFQPWMIFELSALMVQVQEIKSMYGDENALFWLNHLIELGDNPYATTLKVIHRLWEKAEAIDFAVVSAVSQWSLLGSVSADGWNACPSHRFFRLAGHLLQSGIPARSDNIMPLFDQWSQATGLSKVGDGVIDARERFRIVSKNFDDRAEALAPAIGTEDASLLRRVSKGVSLASDHMVAAFLRAPDEYVAPYSYSTSVPKYANPLFRSVYTGIAVVPDMALSELQAKGFLVQLATPVGDKLAVQRMIEPFTASAHNFCSAEDATKFEALALSCDYLVSETDRTSEDMQTVKLAAFRDHDLTPFELIG